MWSPDGSRLASADATIKIWDLMTGNYVSGAEKHVAIKSISWSPDGNLIATISSPFQDREVRIWDTATGDCVSFFESHRLDGTSLAWSSDGRHIALAGTAIKIWDPTINKPRSIFIIVDVYVWAKLDWSKDGAWLASLLYYDGVRIWDPMTGCTSILPDSQDVTSIAWSQNSCKLASGSWYGEVHIWDPVTREYISAFEGHVDPIICLVWSHDGRLASGSTDETVRIWDPEARRCIAVLAGPFGKVRSISWSLDGRWLASMTKTNKSTDYIVTVWDSATGQCISSINIDFLITQAPTEVVNKDDFSDALQFDTETLNRLHTIGGTFDFISDTLILAFTPNLSPAVGQQIGYGISTDMAWITYRRENLIWLPSEYRPDCSSLFSILETKAGIYVGILCSSGRAITLTLAQDISIQRCDSSCMVG